MKKLIKYLISLTVIVALSAAFMANTHKSETSTKAVNPPPCWITIFVQLQGDCVFVNDSTDYIVNLSIFDICNDPSTPIYSGQQQGPSENGNVFSFCIQDTLCVNDMASNCFKIVATAVKKNTVNDEIVCDGQQAEPTTNCEGLLEYDGETIIVTMD